MGRQMFDKRTLRKIHRQDFVRAVEECRADIPLVPVHREEQSDLAVYIRKRPIFDHEICSGEFDVVTAAGPKAVLHDCRMEHDLKHAFICNLTVPVPAFGEDCSNKDVCDNIGLEEMVQVALSAGDATCVMFGQTGSGKTHTIDALRDYAASDLMGELLCMGSDAPSVSVQCFEVSGGSITDLLNPKSSAVAVREDALGAAVVSGCSEAKAETAETLVQIIKSACARRTSRATAKNDSSSRSHAFYRLNISGGVLGSERGSLTLVDLAGSERNHDSMNHDLEQRKESAQINSSLAVLKECIRLRSQQLKGMKGSGMHLPFRESLLTRLLRSALEGSTAEQQVMTVVVATVSPNASDTEHTLNTMRNAALMAGADTEDGGRGGNSITEAHVPVELREAIGPDGTPLNMPVEREHPSKWSCEQVEEWLCRVDNGKFRKFAGKVQNVDGKQLTRWPELRFKQVCGDDARKGQILFRLFKDEKDAANAAKARAKERNREFIRQAEL